MTLQIWDTAGQEKYMSLSVAYYRGSDVCLLVFDLNDKASFNHLKEWRDCYLGSCPINENINIQPFIIVGNKCDIDGKAVSNNEIEHFCHENGNLNYIEVSAKSGKGVEEIFIKAAKIATEIRKLYTHLVILKLRKILI